MKKLVFTFGTVLTILFSGNLYAQIQIPTSIKSVEQTVDENLSDNFFAKKIQEALNPGSSFTASDTLQTLLDSNTDYVNDVLEVSSSDILEDEKTTAIDSLKTNRQEYLESLLGESKAADYYNIVKNKVEPLVEKYKMAKLFL